MIYKTYVFRLILNVNRPEYLIRQTNEKKHDMNTGSNMNGREEELNKNTTFIYN
jgi:hypothetical protein